MASAAPPQRSRFRRFFVTSLKVFAYLLIIGLVALGVAVSVAVSQLPCYGELIRRDDLGQMIRVRAADGTIIHAMGPSFGEWLRYDQIPPIMRDAMVAVEDRRFRSHPGVDPIGIARALMVRASEGRWRQGGSTITQQLARNIFLTNDRSFARKVREGDPGAGARMALLQGPDPRALSQPRLFRRRRLWHRRGLAPLLRP